MPNKGTKHANCATLLGTHEYFEKVSVPKHVNHPPRQFGRMGWIVSAIGFGSYRVGTSVAEHRKALVDSLRHGVNLIDTSTNYGDGDSERLIGSVLESGIHEGWLRREEVVVVSKVGYVQGSNLVAARERIQVGNPYPDIVEYTDDCWHCIHPDYIADQLEKSRRRLGLKCIDVYLLHNPEYFFSTALHSKSRPDIETLRAEFYRRIRNAFEYLENAVADGKIQCYGVSSNTLGKPQDDPESTSLDEFCRIAGDINTHNHFAAVQLPLNLLEAIPITTRGNDDKNFPELAHAREIAVLANRPLNAFFNGQLIRLSDFPKGVIAHPFKQCLSNVQDLEAEFREKYVPQLDLGDSSGENLFCWGTELAGVTDTRLGVEHWNQIEAQVRWKTQGVMQAITEQTKLEGWSEWQQRYSRRLEELLQSCLAIARQTSNKTSEKIRSGLVGNVPDSYSTAPLSQQAIATLLSTDGVTSVLVGMRRPEYVADALEALNLEYAPNSENAFKAFISD